MDITKKLKHWYEGNKRDLPWRHTKDPYKIWLSEIILQQTRVVQGISYYYTFIREYPDIRALANASLDDVLKNWQGLGYYTRARNLHETARELHFNNHDIFPNTYDQIIKLKGIGEYTAAAIASFAFDEPVAVVDGNIQRFLSRFYGIKNPINSTKGKKEFREIAQTLLDIKDPGTHNQAMMEFGAIQCVPQNPDCTLCPFHSNCYAYNNGMIKELPVKIKSKKPRNRYFYYLVIRYRENVYLEKRKEKDIWKSLYQFPLIETEQQITIDELKKQNSWQKIFPGTKPKIDRISEQYKHILSHQRLMAYFVIVQVNQPGDYLNDNLIACPVESIDDYAVPRLIERFLENEKPE